MEGCWDLGALEGPFGSSLICLIKELTVVDRTRGHSRSANVHNASLVITDWARVTSFNLCS